LASVRTIYRVLAERGETQERRNQRLPHVYAKPSLTATAPNQVWTWDITKLATTRVGVFLHVYVIIDLFSRYVVGWMVASRESKHLAAQLFAETIARHGIEPGLTVHADRGSAMKSDTLAQLLATAQRLALRPPALALARPGAVDDMMRTRALIASLAPEIRRRTAALRHQQIATDALRAETEQALATILDADQDEDALAQSAAQTARLAALPAPAFPNAAPGTGDAYRLPVAGKVLIGMGERSSVGVRARGLTLATAPGATVVAPAMGRIAYAGPFRGYGDIVILDHGHGWTTMLAGLELVTAHSGSLVAAGAPLGHMTTSDPRLTIELRHDGRAIDAAAMALQ
jgi:septal ring factor EnvC (AmiA/AmiB activator)